MEHKREPVANEHWRNIESGERVLVLGKEQNIVDVVCVFFVGLDGEQRAKKPPEWLSLGEFLENYKPAPVVITRYLMLSPNGDVDVFDTRPSAERAAADRLEVREITWEASE